MLHWSIFLAGVAFTAITSTQASLIEKWENPDLDQGIAEQDHKNVMFAGGYSSGYVNGGIRDAGRILHGTEVQQESKYPFMVSLRRADTGQHFCGGSIITPLHILTAAHCISKKDAKNEHLDLSVLMPTVGVHRRSEGGSYGQSQTLKVVKAHITPTWYASGNGILAGDLAILELETPIQFNERVSPVCLTREMPPIGGMFLQAMGWGLTENGFLDALMEAYVHVVDSMFCGNDVSRVCFRHDGTSTCEGDSGGPLVLLDPEANRYTQVALVSGGDVGPCPRSVFSGTNLVYWYEWIEQKVEETLGRDVICQKIQ